MKNKKILIISLCAVLIALGAAGSGAQKEQHIKAQFDLCRCK